MKDSKNRRIARGGVVPRPIQPGLVLLVEAYDYAMELSRDIWDFAVELRSLRAVGLTQNDCRWLVCKEYVDHACEIIQRNRHGRQFERTGALTFNEQTCFVLTEPGVRVAKKLKLRAKGRRSYEVAVGLRESKKPFDQPVLPRWDDVRHEFFLGNQLVKVFKVPSPNQEAILSVFEEEGWPPRIDDPLTPAPHLEPKRRLHDAIKSLNRNQKARLVRFRGDGTGEGVLWEPFEKTGS